MEIMQAQLAEIGVDMSVESIDVGAATSTFFEDLGHDLYCAGWSGRPDPSQTTNSLFAADSFYNPGKYDSPGMAAALESGQRHAGPRRARRGLLGDHPPEPGRRAAPAAAAPARHHGGVRQHRRVHPEPLRQGRRLVPLARVLTPARHPDRNDFVTTGQVRHRRRPRAARGGRLMGWEPELEELRRRHELAEQLGGPEGIARQRALGKLTVRERLDRARRPGTFRAFGRLRGSAHLRRRRRARVGAARTPRSRAVPDRRARGHRHGRRLHGARRLRRRHHGGARRRAERGASGPSSGACPTSGCSTPPAAACAASRRSAARTCPTATLHAPSTSSC